MTAKEIIQSLTTRLKPGAGHGIDITYHFIISGERGGEFTVRVNNGLCTVVNGLSGEPKCIIETTDQHYEDAETGKINNQMAVLMGKIKVSNIGSVLKFAEMFEKVKVD